MQRVFVQLRLQIDARVDCATFVHFFAFVRLVLGTGLQQHNCRVSLRQPGHSDTRALAYIMNHGTKTRQSGYLPTSLIARRMR